MPGRRGGPYDGGVAEEVSGDLRGRRSYPKGDAAALVIAASGGLQIQWLLDPGAL